MSAQLSPEEFPLPPGNLFEEVLGNAMLSLEASPDHAFGRDRGASSPALVLTRICKLATTPDDIQALTSVFLSDRYNDISQTYNATRPDGDRLEVSQASHVQRLIADRLADGLLADPSTAIDHTEFFAMQRRVSHHPAVIERLIVSTESALVRRLNAEPAGSDVFHPAAQIAWQLEAAGMLSDDITQNNVICANPHIITEPPFAELMQHKLSKQSAEVSSAKERSSLWLARLCTQRVLEKYAARPDRHTDNVERIQRVVFPDAARTTTLDRESTIRVANSVTAALNKRRAPGDQQAPLDRGQPGVLATALERLLEITSAEGISPDEYESHRLEDKVITSVIGMLLEQRNYNVSTPAQ